MTKPLAPTTIGERQAIAGLREQAEKAADALLMDVLGDSYSDTTLRVTTDHIVSFIRKHPLATPTTNAPVADREVLARAMYDSRPHTVITSALAEVTGLPFDTVLTWDVAIAGGADMSPLFRYADAVLVALRQTLPIHGEMREALERIVATVNEPDDHQGRMMRMARIARNALQGDGL